MGETVPVFLFSPTHLITSQNLRLCHTTKRYAFTSCSPFSFFKMELGAMFEQTSKTLKQHDGVVAVSQAYPSIWDGTVSVTENPVTTCYGNTRNYA